MDSIEVSCAVPGPHAQPAAEPIDAVSDEAYFAAAAAAIRARVRIHPVQYTLVGAALVLFFLLLLALSEVMSFGAAYATGAAACAALITLYSARALRSMSRALVVTGELAAIYGLLYIILRQQDYALLFGAGGLFLMLAIVMFATRNVDWYGRDTERK